MGSFIGDPARAALYRRYAWPVAVRAMRAGYIDITCDAPGQIASSDAFQGPIMASVPDRYRDAGTARALLALLASDDTPVVDVRCSDAEPPTAEQQQTAAQWFDDLLGGERPTREVRQRQMTVFGAGTPDCDDPDAYIRVDSQP